MYIHLPMHYLPGILLSRKTENKFVFSQGSTCDQVHDEDIEI